MAVDVLIPAANVAVRSNVTCLRFVMSSRMAACGTAGEPQVPGCRMTPRTCHTRTMMFRYKIIRIVIKSPGLPYGGAMACLTVMRILSNRMIGDFRRGVIDCMASVTVGVQSNILPVPMTLRARRRRVGAGEREQRLRVIERCWIPCSCRMACGAIVIEVS